MNTSIGHDDMPESFAPETVDDEIARYLGAEPQPTGTTYDAHLIHSLAAYHTLPAAATASLSQVRIRVRTTAEAPGDGATSRRRDTMRGTTNAEAHPQPQQQWQASATPSSRIRPLMLLPAPLRAVAAVLVVALLVSGFVAVLHLRGGRQIATTPSWQNVAITRANTQGHTLDFDPTQVQVEYAVSQVDGTIYALGDNHLWYSANGGTTYQPFTRSLPALPNDMSNLTYAISTVPGLQGVFASATVGDAYPTIYYAEAGAESWRTLNISNAAQPVTQAASSVMFSSADIGKAIFYEHGYGKSVQARAVGNWLLLLAQRNDGGIPVLVGTPDFGMTWYALSATLAGTCVRFAANPADARQLFCLMSSDTVEQTTDGGVTWTPMVNINGNSTYLTGAIWASRRAVYSYFSTSAKGNRNIYLMQHPVGAGDWFGAATVPRLPIGSDTEVIGVSPDDTVYAVTALEGAQTHVQISMLAPSAREFAPVGNEATLTLPNSAIFFDLGGVYAGDAPAVYAHTALSAEVTAPQPLYRLALPPAPDNSPLRNARPVVEPTIPPTATSGPHGACTSTPGDVADIQNGGYGADLNTFAERWGPSDGVAAGSVYFGRWADGTPKVQVADAMPSNHRVYQVTYLSAKTQAVMQGEGEALAKSILPKDATLIEQNPVDNGMLQTYCSAALIAAFPDGVKNINGPLPHNGLVVVDYTLRSDGYLFGIGFTPLP